MFLWGKIVLLASQSTRSELLFLHLSFLKLQNFLKDHYKHLRTSTPHLPNLCLPSSLPLLPPQPTIIHCCSLAWLCRSDHLTSDSSPAASPTTEHRRFSLHLSFFVSSSLFSYLSIISSPTKFVMDCYKFLPHLYSLCDTFLHSKTMISVCFMYIEFQTQ